MFVSRESSSTCLQAFVESAADDMYGISPVLFASSFVPEQSTLMMAGTAIRVGFTFGWPRGRNDRRRG
jgi:hypothetical protein